MGRPANRIQAQSPNDNPIDLLSEDDVRDISSANAFRNGLGYRIQGRVMSLRVEEAVGLIHASVRGSERKPYSQSIEIEQWADGSVDIAGTCS